MVLRRFKQVDVFSTQSCRGNPLAVVLDADGLEDATMQAFAAWTHLSETTFLMRPTSPDADYRVRIFTPTAELPFAGHPTLGSCHAWLESGAQPHQDGMVIQECGAGLVRIKREASRLAFEAPPLLRTGPVEEAILKPLLRGIGISRDDVVDHQWLVNGPQWIGLLLGSAEQVLSLRPDPVALKGFDFGAVGPYPSPSPFAFEVRAFPYSDGPFEDPVTGSLNAGFAQWLIGRGIAPRTYIASQGTLLGRSGRVHVTCEEGEALAVSIGGDSTTIVDGQVFI
jgi:PhzF family phenazine biosynthesis protein